MRVKRLEIQGFKSFKDKTVIHFDHSITGIVGPNGCGKSNIVDAFFWVMGEQSYKHMRGSSSEDLIFNGSSKYSPLGYAEATLVMETDLTQKQTEPPAGATVKDIPFHLRAKDVAVTRRVYRTGEGEYFINGVPVRLKDVQELFMDTGVGAKGYSVIEQGQIGKTVNAKPEERRLLIEEAAGIAKYKARKKESLRKIEAAEQNLSRLNDVLQEIERNLHSLERQAQKARLYRKYKDELLNKEVSWGRRKWKILLEKTSTFKKEREVLEQEILGFKTELQISELNIETGRIDHLTETKRAEELQNKVQELSSRLTREQSALELSKKRQEDLISRLQSLRNEKESLQNSLLSERDRFQSLQKELQEGEFGFQKSTETAHLIEAQVKTKRTELDTFRNKTEQSKREHLQNLALASELTARISGLKSRVESTDAQIGRVESQIQIYAVRHQVVLGELENAGKSSVNLSQEYGKIKTELQNQTDLQKTQEIKLSNLKSKKDEYEKELTLLKSRLESLEELEQSHEGFEEGPKAVLDWAKETGVSHKLKALVDLFEISNGYETALQGWLRGRLEFLMVEEDSLAFAAMQTVKTNQCGSATLYLSGYLSGHLSKLPAESPAECRALNGLEVLGKLTDFVKIQDSLKESHFQQALKLIERVYVVRSIQGLTQNREELGAWSLVDLEGCVLDREGVLKIGALDSTNSAALIRRKKSISELLKQTEEVKQAFSSAVQSYDEARLFEEEIRAKIQSIQSKTQVLEIERATLNRDLSQTEKTSKEILSQLEQAQVEKETILKTKVNDDVELNETGERLSKAQSELGQLVLHIQESDQAFLEKDLEVRTLETSLQQSRVEEASLRERLVSLQKSLENSELLIRERENRVGELNEILEKASLEHQLHAGGDSELENRAKELMRELGQIQSELASSKDRIEQTNAKINLSLDRTKEIHALLEQKNITSNQVALEIEKTSSEITYLVQSLEEKYGRDCLSEPTPTPIQEEMENPVITQEMTEEEERELAEDVEKLRERMRRLGEVNVMAIDEYEEIKKRFDYLTGEKQDLLRSIEDLNAAIEYINKTSEDRFQKAFTAISDRFEKLFPIIFGGGQANLSLVYPEGSKDILEAGVDILAQPPGKKVTNITLLSGGEKALTAVSLIFAIFMVKPSPFCVLDEVDAPLDDANIGKFNALLKEMSAKSQFILITHNKKTMELNDTLYGVTMEEPGVSKMVSIEMH